MALFLNKFYDVSTDSFLFDFTAFSPKTHFLALEKFLFFKLSVIIVLLRASREDTRLNYINGCCNLVA